MQVEIFQGDSASPIKWYNFKNNTDLGKLHDCIPWDEIAKLFPKEENRLGRTAWFSNKGKVGLMFLKAYTNLSDEKLIERINTDWSLQLFCFRLFRDDQQIKDVGLVSRVRSELSADIDLDRLQEVLIKHWKGDLETLHVLLMDATCYESDVRNPTDVKLLWECCHYTFEKLLYPSCKSLSIARPRSKYKDQKLKYLNYSKLRKKGHKATQKRRRSLLYLLEKGLGQLQEVLNTGNVKLEMGERKRLRIIKMVLLQQRYMYEHKVNKVKNRIISLAKPWLRPIIRGKETKRVEYGFKAHILQVDGLCVIDCLSASAFNEGTRLKASYYKHQQLFKKATHIGADGIYASNKNRVFITGKGVVTNFKKKGPKSFTTEEKLIRSIIAKERATRMEGSFGTHKRNYGLGRIKARTEKNEKLWIFMGIMTANAVLISKKKQEKKKQQQTHPTTGKQMVIAA